MKIAVAGTGYVGLSVALLLSQHNTVHALDIIPSKVESLNKGLSPIVDREITAFLDANTSGKRPLDFHATLDPTEAYSDAEFAVIATPTNYDSQKNYFDTSSVEAAIEAVRSVNKTAWIVVKSTVPVGYTEETRKRFNDDHIIFSPEFLREGKALYDNLHPYSRRCTAG
jgi:UDPglucose 6-dehydrogenase